MSSDFPERLFPHGKYDSRRMRVFALAISWISIFYNGLEGGVSIGMGIDVASRALIVFGVQSAVEVLSAALVIYRFRHVANDSSSSSLSLEKRATFGIGVLFIILTIGTWIASIIALVEHDEPDSSTPSLIISASALVLTLFIWLPKPWIAAELDSSVMRGEAACSLACIYLTIVLFSGSLIYKLWHGGWWIDSVVAILLGFFFLREGWQMVAWARHKDFNGGCCRTCSTPSTTISSSNTAATLINGCANVEKRDCCSSKTDCVERGACISKPIVSDKNCSDDVPCCSGPTKSSTYGSTADFSGLNNFSIEDKNDSFKQAQGTTIKDDHFP